MMPKDYRLTVLLLLSLAGCGQNQNFSHEHAENPSKSYALIADSLGSGLFSKTKMARDKNTPAVGHGESFALLSTLIVGYMTHWNNDAFRRYTDFSDSAYNRAIKYGNGRIDQMSVIIGSTVKPDQFIYHKNNIDHWNGSAVKSIVFALGGNDICRNDESPEDFRENYTNALGWVASNFQGRNIVVVTPPKILSLSQGGLGDYTIMRRRVFALRCSEYYQSVCPNYSNQWRFEQFIGIIREIAYSFHQVSIVDISGAAVGSEDLSADCFHPNEDGIRRVGRLMKPYFTSQGSAYAAESGDHQLCTNQGRGWGCVWDCGGKKCAKQPDSHEPCLVTRFSNGDLCRN